MESTFRVFATLCLLRLTGALSAQIEVTSSGSVGIGTASPYCKLQSYGGDVAFDRNGSGMNATIQAGYTAGQSYPAALSIRGAVIGGNFATYLAFNNDYAGNTSNYSMAMASGLLIFYRGGSPYYSWYAGDTGSPLSFWGTTGNVVGSITTNSTATSYNTSSDLRLKTNIRDLTGAGAMIDALRPRIFDWKTGEKDSIGFVAQELYQVYPAAVSKGDDDPVKVAKQWSVDFSKLVPLLTAETRSLRARVSTLENENSALAARLRSMEARLVALERNKPAA